MRVDRDRDGGPPDRVDHRDEIRVARRENPQVFHDAARRADLGPGDVQTAPFQDGASAPADELGLAAGDVDRRADPRFTISVAVFRGDGFLEPTGAHFLRRASDEKRPRSCGNGWHPP